MAIRPTTEFESNRVVGFSTGERTVGFPAAKTNAPAGAGPAAVVPPSPARRAIGAPTPKRPKGRWFISLVILSICGVVTGALYNEFFRFQAYGLIDGRVVRISAPWSGVIETMYAQDGQYVEQGQLLATLRNTELKLRFGELRDRTRIAQASLEARLAELKSAKHEQSERSLRIHVDYFELLSRLSQEKSRLDDLRSVYQRQRNLNRKKVTSQQDYESALHAYEGQTARVTELQQAVDQMKQGMDQLELPHDDLLNPTVEKTLLENLMAEWDRLAEYEDLGEIRAPVAGRIVRRHQFSGEFSSESSVIFEILEEGSISASIYLPQDKARRFRRGDLISLTMPPYRGQVDFSIDRFGDTMTSAPDSLQRYYRRDERLVVMHARPRLAQLRDTQGDDSIWLGAEVRLPRFDISSIW